MFAGPNGSGKSTIKDQVAPHLISTYVNADEIEKEVNDTGRLDLSPFDIFPSADVFRSFVDDHPLIKKAGFEESVRAISLEDQRLDFRRIDMNSYYASVIADFIRHTLLDGRRSFTFETVMSSPDKVRFMDRALANGYRTYLYFIATDSVDINISRVSNRVEDGGHPVSEEKIRKRYVGSLDLLPSAIAASSRAFIFDNSSEKSVFLAEITAGTELRFHCEDMPGWFIDAYVDKVSDTGTQ